MKQLKAILLAGFCLLSVVGVRADGLGDPNLRDVRGISRWNAFNLKAMPAFYWDCIGFEAEYPFSETFTVGVNALFRYGRTDNGVDLNFKIRPEDFQDPGIRLEFAIKHYFVYNKKTGKNAPVGFYLQANGAYMHGNNIFFDGNSRPYTLQSRWRFKKNSGITNLRAQTDFDTPLPISVGGGIGYQAIVIPNHIIANIMVGTNVYYFRKNSVASRNNRVYSPVYVSPSIGYVF